MMSNIRGLMDGLKSEYISDDSSTESLWYLASMLQPFLYYTVDSEQKSTEPRFDYYSTCALLGIDWEYYCDVDRESKSLARAFLDNAFGQTSPFELPGSYMLTIETIGTKLRIDLVSIPLIGSLTGSEDRSIFRPTFQYLEPWADSSGYKVSTLLGEFEDLINSSLAKEYDYQLFFEKNPEFLFLLGDYDDVRSQVSISLDIVVAPHVDTSKSRPDFMLHRFTDDTWDILELKKAVYQTPLITGSGITASDPRQPSQVLQKAISQMKSYRAIFQQDQTKRYLQSKFSMDVVAPRLVLLMGRSENFGPSQYRRQLVEDHSVDLYTYDDLFKIAHHRKLSKR